MCIRDSAYAWYLALAERMVKEGLTRHGHLSEVLEALTDLEALHHALINVMEEPLYASLYTCLLYTSDAADERSSVDLGGRRIIKKKNSNEHKGRCVTY